MLLSNTLTGESPLLSMRYGHFDNGQNVFSLYDNFAGTTLNSSKWSSNGAFTINNGISFAYGGGGSNAANSITTFSTGNIAEAYGYLANPRSSNELGAGALGGIGFGIPNIDGSPAMTNGWVQQSINNFGITVYTTPTPHIHSAIDNPLPTQNTLTVFGLSIPSTNLKLGYTNYIQSATVSFATGTNAKSVILGFQQFNYINNEYYWARVRTYPPNGILPATSFGNVIPAYTAPTTPSQPSASNAIADVGQYETFSTSFTGSSSPYTYNWIISNSVDNSVVYSISFSNSLTTNTFTFQVPGYFVSNSPLEANVVVTDAGSVTANSVYSSNFVVFVAPLAAGVPAMSNSVVDAGQYETFTATPSGGIPPYSYQWYSGTNQTCTGDSAIGGATSASYTTQPAAGT